jgi:uncharacterized protein (DUF362 family)/Pyruvate/2-oxoacid:ferredoxin oxidoreductase delta subunit
MTDSQNNSVLPVARRTEIDDRAAVGIDFAESYDAGLIESILRRRFDALGFDPRSQAGRRVVVKPNLLIRYAPEKAATTHPAVIEAVCRIFVSAGADVMIAESNGGGYSEGILRPLYRICGMEAAAENSGAVLNFDTSFRTVAYAEGVASKSFDILEPLCTADMIIDCCKLKTHALAGMTAGVKNMFGAVPGVKKFETHARYNHDLRMFFSFITDLCRLLYEAKDFLCITDGIEGMEGNGPSAGTPRKVNAILTSFSPFQSDVAAAALIGHEGQVPINELSCERGYSVQTGSELVISGDSIEKLKVPDFRPASPNPLAPLRNIPEVLRSRPKIDHSLCRSCGECVSYCPVKAIKLEEKRGKNVASIDTKKCIRCFCCQELCTFKAISVSGLPIFDTVNRLGFGI